MKPFAIKISSTLLAVVIVVGCIDQPTVSGQEKSSILSMFRKKKPVTNEELFLKAEHGPWLVLAATLSGDNAQAQALELAKEIRAGLKLPTYVLQKTFDNTGVLGSTTQLVNELDGTTTQYRAWTQYANGDREQVFAVLVGEFSSTEDPRIPETLRLIRFAHPRTLGGDGSQSSKSDSDSSNWLVQKYRSLLWSRTDREDNQNKGPMGAAFVTRNPMLPDDFFQAPKLDGFVAGLNKQVKYSLLECPGRFTVRVASFYGHAITDLSSGSMANKQRDTTDALDKAAAQANKLTMALRKQNVPAYQFHDRFGSFVTIGSFDDLGQELTTGGFQYNPDMLAIVDRWCGYRVVDVKDPRTGAMSRRTSLKSLDKIPFDIDGKPMAVPRARTSGLYGGSLLGR